MSAVRAAKELSVVLYAVSYDSTSTMQARGSKSLNGTLEAVECVALSLHNDVEALVVVVVTYLADSHSDSSVNGCVYTVCGLGFGDYERA
jgi:hypothetical protein